MPHLRATVAATLFCLTLFVSVTPAEENKPATSAPFQFEPREESFISPVDGKPQTYLVAEPGKDGPGERLLVIYLHGSGSRQDQGMKQGIYGDVFGRLGRWMAQRRSVYICPDYRGDSWMGPAAEEDLVELLRIARETYRPAKVLLTGGSMGGTSALIFASRHPDLLDGVLAWCPATAPVAMVPKFAEQFRTGYGGLPAEVPAVYAERTAQNHAEALAKLPVVIIHGAKDTVIPVEHARTLVERLKTHKGAIHYIELPDGDHDAPLGVDLKPPLRWLLSEMNRLPKTGGAP